MSASAPGSVPRSDAERPLRVVPRSRAYWELKAEQMMNRIFDPEEPIDLAVEPDRPPHQPAEPPAVAPRAIAAAPPAAASLQLVPPPPGSAPPAAAGSAPPVHGPAVPVGGTSPAGRAGAPDGNGDGSRRSGRGSRRRGGGGVTAPAAAQLKAVAAFRQPRGVAHPPASPR